MLRERSNAKPLVTILFFNIFDKIGNFAVLWFAAQYQYPDTSTFRIKNKTLFTLNLMQN